MRRELRVEDMMSTALITTKATDTLDAADVEMKLANIRHLPVVDDRNHVVGVVSSRDLLRVGRSGVALREIMSRRVVTVTCTTSAEEAADLMLEKKIGCLPVVGSHGELVGMVTDTDFVRFASDVLSGRWEWPRGQGV